ncbi:hypothetical protein F53441_10382 [Fusarium austroafricanum]|uniref:Amidoligase enzyme n=1 Tax=Fusarium austroafricanum TaxID=2364996 RepID=A0A8H4K9L8_9HYPO|nr:hypothetical protein F53441_10382 [Fusarium austroafricanum]
MSSLSWEGITFGIELEFMTPCPENKRIWRREHPTAAARLNMAEILAKSTSLPIACECVHPSDHPSDKTCPICTSVPGENRHDKICVLTHPEVLDVGTKLETNFFYFKAEFLNRSNDLSRERDWPAVEIATPIFRAGELQSGLPTMKTVLTKIRQMGLEINADESCGMHVHVGVENGMTLRLAQKITTLAILLETTLLLRLVAPCRWDNIFSLPLCENSAMATEDRHQHPGDHAPLDQYIPGMKAMHPGKWNNNDPSHFYSMFNAVWSTTSLRTLKYILFRKRMYKCGFTLSLRSKDVQLGELENSPSTVEFRYSQMVFDHELLRNWTEIVAGIVALAQADADEFKKCVELIMKINHEAEGMAWKVLLKDVFKLEHRIPEWEAQLAKFKCGEYISHLDEKALLKPE